MDANDKKILIVDDDPSLAEVLSQTFLNAKYLVCVAHDATEAYNKISEFEPDLILTDLELPGMSGLELLSRLRQNENYVTVVFISGNADSRIATEALRAGADDYIRKPFRVDELLARVEVAFRVNRVHRELLQANKHLQRLIEHDDLTGLLNMRSMFDRLDQELKRSRRTESSVGCVMIDTDHFKEINDHYDHLFGNQVLKELGSIIRSELRESDLGARYGGDEFLIVLTDTQQPGVWAFCERLRLRVSNHIFEYQGQPVRLTLSIGFSMGGGRDEKRGAKDVVRDADKALIAAKSAGRNQTHQRPLKKVVS
jgi:two-component system cell cycle response regulator